MVENAIELHQTLHGYGDGHQLLSSSLQLTREQQWQLLVMSDLSGPSFRGGFDSYLTGYPLEAGRFYCLARTWFAPELSRPGCVWTHTILVSDTDVARIQDFRSILSYFRRPISKDDVESYAEPILNILNVGQPYHLDQNVGNTLLSFLYGSPSSRIVLKSESSRTYEELVLGVLSQQWPRLRRSFRFCTGALAIRDVNFDLAVVPKDVRTVDTNDKEAITIGPNDVTLMTEGSEDWVRIALDDLLKADLQTGLRRFLWKFGPDYNEGRSAFRPLCEIHLASTRSSENTETILSATSHFFPQADSSKRLKAEFFGIKGSLASSVGEARVVRALVTHPAAASIPADVAAIEQRARTLVDSDDETAIQIAITATSLGGARAQQFLDGFAAGVISKPEIFHTLSSPLTFELLKMHPELLTSAGLWKVPASQQLVIAAYVPSLPRAAEYGKKITEAVIAANAWPAMPSLLAQFGYEAVGVILNWIDVSAPLPLSVPETLLSSLAEQRKFLIEIVRQNTLGVGALRVASTLLDPRAENVRGLGTKPWVRMLERNVHFASFKSELRSKAFALSLGLFLGDEAAVQLVREGFSAVYEAARNSHIDDETWAFVEPYLPWYIVTWDRCARLIRGVVHLFLHRKWPASEFASTFITAEQFQRALDEAGGTRRGSRYVKGICEQARTGSLTMDKIHAEVLARHC